MYSLRLAVIAAILFAATIISVTAEVPQQISYQGRLTDTLGNPIDTIANITITIFEDQSGTSSMWSETHPSVNVVDGLFEVKLGAVTPFPSSLFDGSVRYVGVQIAGGAISEPLTAVVSTAYALHSARADTAAYAQAGPGSGATGWVDDGAVVRLATEGDNVGIGTSSPGFKLEVKSPATGDGMRVTSSDGSQLFRIRQNSDGSCEAQISNDAGASTVMLRGSGNSTFNAGNVGIGTTTPNERLVVGQDMGSYAGEMIAVGNSGAGSYSGLTTGEDPDNRGWMVWKNDNNYLVLGTKEGGQSYDNSVIIAGGKVGIGGTLSYAKLYAKDQGTAIFGENEGSIGGAAVFGKSSNPAGQGVKGMAMAEDGKGVIGTAEGTNGNGVRAEASGTSGVALYAEVSGSAKKAIQANADVNFGVGIEARGGVSGLAARFYGNVSIHSRVDDGLIMQLGEGLDYAEGFDLSDPQRAEPGTVVIIDSDNPGQLAVSTKPYDTRVAGIVAGAEGLGSGVRLGAGGFDLDIALAGRVYCNADASESAIEPGDLLTTSSMAGHAMKATDYMRAQGAILGKAMQKMEKGQTGRILVLVTLQ